MNPLERALRTVVDELVSLDRRFALVGGLAVSVRAEPRMTRDADIAVAVLDDADAEELVRALIDRGYTTLATVEQEVVGRLATVRLAPAQRDERLITDLLFASSGIEHEIVAAADKLDVVDGLSMPVAAVGHLIAMKLLARDDRRRPADADDLASLSVVATEDDWQVAAAAVALITERGFARQRDLVAALDQLRREGAY